jgi:hypothetical protein
MSNDDSPLGNLREQMEQADQDTDSQQSRNTGQEQEEEDEVDPRETPAFTFKQAKQRPLYPRETRWTDWEDAKYEIEGILRQHGVRNPEGREFDDAALQLAVENPEAIADLILEARGVHVDED